MSYRLLFIIGILLLGSCTRNEDTFLITKDSVGPLMRDTPISRLDSIFSKDSVVKSAYEGELRYASTERILIYEKSGVQLMEITPGLNNENIKVVENIKILNPRYATDEGISLHSTFKDIKNQYTINRIENSISSIVLFIDEAHLYIALDKSFLPEQYRWDLSRSIAIEDIPDQTVIKHFMIGWN